MMFSGLEVAARQVHVELMGLFWILLPLVMVSTIAVQFLKNRDEPLDPGDLLRRTVVAVVLILSIDLVVDSLANLSDALTSKITQGQSVWTFLEKMGPAEGAGTSDGWFDFKRNAIYLLSLLCYLIAYLGFFVSEAIVAFVWCVLYSLAPLMILCYVCRPLSGITVNLYRGLGTVMCWRILYGCLGALLVKMELHPSATGLDDWLLASVANICIGMSMLLVPVFTGSLIGNGLSQAGATLAAGATLTATGLVKKFAARTTKRAVNRASKELPLHHEVTPRRFNIRQSAHPPRTDRGERRMPKSPQNS